MGLVVIGCAETTSTMPISSKGSSVTQTVPVEAYERAEQLMGPNLVKKVYNTFMLPHWIGTSDEFWYRSDSKEGHQFFLVDASTGAKQLAFDHKKISQALQQQGVINVKATKLPFKSFSFSENRSHISFLIDSTEYDCDLGKASCSSTKLDLNVSQVYNDLYFKKADSIGPEGVLISHDGKLGVETRSDNNLWLLDMATNKSRQLTFDGAENVGYGMYPDNRADFVKRYYNNKKDLPANAQWAPNSRFVLVPLIDQRHVEPYPFIESVRKDGTFRPKVHSPRLPLVGEKPATFVWYLIDTQTGKKHRVDLPYEDLIMIQQDFIAVRDFWWSEDSTRLYMAAHGDNLESGFLFEVDTLTGKTRTVIEESLSPRFDMHTTTYSAVNVRIIKDGKEALWWSQRDGWGHLYRYDVATGEQLNQVTSGEWMVRDIIDIDEKAGIIYFVAGGSIEGKNPYFRHLYRVNLDGSELTLLSPEDADHIILPNKEYVLSMDGAKPYPPISPSGKYAVYNYSTVSQPTKLAISRVEDGSVISIVDEADASGLYEAGWRAPEEFMVLADDGKTELWGVIYKPSDFDASKKYPIIDSQYASPLTAITPRHFYQAYRGLQPLAPSSYAELGFIVISMDARGTINRSGDFGLYGYGRLDEIGLYDHVHAFKKLAEERPYMDIDKVGIVGHSYGGFTTVRAMLEYPDFFKVGISSAGSSEMHAMYNDYHWTAFQGKPRYKSTGTEWIGSDKTEIPENHRSIAASLEAEKLQGKLLIQFGELDENVPPAQILQFIDALIAKNKDFDMLYLPNRDHQLIGEGYVMRRNWDYMVRHLAGKTPPNQYKLNINSR